MEVNVTKNKTVPTLKDVLTPTLKDVLTFEVCGTNLTVPAPLRDYCSTCNPIFGKSTTLGFDDIVARAPMPEPVFTPGFARHVRLGMQRWRRCKAEAPGAEPGVIGKVPGLSPSWGPTYDAVSDILRQRWVHRLRKAYNRVVTPKVSGTQTGRLSSKQSNLSPPKGIPAGKTTSLQGRAKAMTTPITEAKAVLKRVAELVESGEMEEAHALFLELKPPELKNLSWSAFKAEVLADGPKQKLKGSITKRRRKGVQFPRLLRADPTTDVEGLALLALILDTLDRWSSRQGLREIRREMEKWVCGEVNPNAPTEHLFDELKFDELKRVCTNLVEEYGRPSVYATLANVWDNILGEITPRDHRLFIRAGDLVTGAHSGVAEVHVRSRLKVLDEAVRHVQPHVPALGTLPSDGQHVLNVLEAHPMFVIGLLSIDQRRDWIREFASHTPPTRARKHC